MYEHCNVDQMSAIESVMNVANGTDSQCRFLFYGHKCDCLLLCGETLLISMSDFDGCAVARLLKADGASTSSVYNTLKNMIVQLEGGFVADSDELKDFLERFCDKS